MTTTEIDWIEFHWNCLFLAQQLKRHQGELAIIAPVIRGGLVPAVILAHKLELPISFTINPHTVPLSSRRSDILIIDEVCDTGKTFGHLRTYFPNAIYASVYCKPQGKALCHYHVVETAQHNWLVFPWEIK